jgi:transmembrane sensor
MMTKARVDFSTETAEGPHEEASQWLLRLRSGAATHADADAFRDWCAKEPEQAALLSGTWGALRTAAEEIAQEIAEERRNGVPAWAEAARKQRAVSTGRRAFIGFAVAAGASWLAIRPPLGLWPSIGDLAADYRTGTGEQRRFALSERVTVELNTQTRVDVLAASTATRGIELVAGEAEIDAATPSPSQARYMRPVTVVAGRGRIEAAVARVNVRKTGDQVCVTCISGSAMVNHPLRRVTLKAQEQVIYDDRRVDAIASADPAQVTAWRRGVLVFDGVPVSQVVGEINRYRPGKVILRNATLGRNRMQAQFPIAKVDDVLDMLAKLYGAHVTRLPGDIVLLS